MLKDGNRDECQAISVLSFNVVSTKRLIVLAYHLDCRDIETCLLKNSNLFLSSVVSFYIGEQFPSLWGAKLRVLYHNGANQSMDI